MPNLPLQELLRHFSPCDLILVEGYKHDPIPRIEIHRSGGDRPLLFPRDPHVIAVATDEPLQTKLPQFGLDDAPAVAQFIREFLAGREGRPRLAAVPD